MTAPLHQPGATLGNVLELIDQDVAKRADIVAVLCILRSAQDHVL